MSKKTRRTFSPEFSLETAQLVVEQGYTRRSSQSNGSAGARTVAIMATNNGQS